MAIPTKKSTQLDKTSLCRNKWLELFKITYHDEAGVERMWESVERTTRKVGVGTDGVGVIATLKKHSQPDCLVCVKQYRPPLDVYTLEFPAGLIDDGETTSEAALRELKEETGYIGNITHVGPSTCLDPGIGNSLETLVFVEINGDIDENLSPKQATDEGEFVDVILLPVKNLLEKINEFDAGGVIIDSKLYTYVVGQSGICAHT